MDTDLTFITNEPDANLLDRFRVLIKDAKFFEKKKEGYYQFKKEVSEKANIKETIASLPSDTRTSNGINSKLQKWQKEVEEYILELPGHNNLPGLRKKSHDTNR